MMDEAMFAQLIGSSEYDFQADPGVILFEFETRPGRLGDGGREVRPTGCR